MNEQRLLPSTFKFLLPAGCSPAQGRFRCTRERMADMARASEQNSPFKLAFCPGAINSSELSVPSSSLAVDHDYAAMARRFLEASTVHPWHLDPHARRFVSNYPTTMAAAAAQYCRRMCGTTLPCCCSCDPSVRHWPSAKFFFYIYMGP